MNKRDSGDPKAMLAGLDAIIDEAVSLTVDVDRSTLPPAVGQALDLLVGAQESVCALMAAWDVYDPDAPENQDTEENMLDAHEGLPYIIMFDYRSDSGPTIIGPFPSRTAASDHMLTLARAGFEAEWSTVPISKPTW